MIPLLVLALSLFAMEASGDVYLSDYLGVPSGSSASSSNPPYSTVVSASIYGYGADIPGTFATNQIEFADSGPFEKGIGAHSATRIDFDLDAFRAIEPFTYFLAVAGIDTPSLVEGGIQPPASSGVSFKILLDGVSVFTADIVNGGEPSVPALVDVSTATTLTLITEDFGRSYGNHGAWAIASLTSVPEPTSFVLLAFGGLVNLRRR